MPCCIRLWSETGAFFHLSCQQVNHWREHQGRSCVEHLKHRGLSKPDRIKAVIDNKAGKITKKEIMELCPDISKVTVERTLTDLVKNGYIAKVGAGPSTEHVRI